MEKENDEDRGKDLMTSCEPIYPSGHIGSFTPAHSG